MFILFIIHLLLLDSIFVVKIKIGTDFNITNVPYM